MLTGSGMETRSKDEGIVLPSRPELEVAAHLLNREEIVDGLSHPRSSAWVTQDSAGSSSTTALLINTAAHFLTKVLCIEVGGELMPTSSWASL